MSNPCLITSVNLASICTSIYMYCNIAIIHVYPLIRCTRAVHITFLRCKERQSHISYTQRQHSFRTFTSICRFLSFVFVLASQVAVLVLILLPSLQLLLNRSYTSCFAVQIIYHSCNRLSCCLSVIAIAQIVIFYAVLTNIIAVQLVTAIAAVASDFASAILLLLLNRFIFLVSL